MATTLIAVLNSREVHYYENDGADDGLHKLKSEEQPLLTPHDLSDETFGEVDPLDQQSSQGDTPVTDPQDMQKQEFLNEVAETLNRIALENSYDQIVLVAPPQTTLMLREALDDETQRKITAYIDRDLTGEDEASLPAYLGEVLTLTVQGVKEARILADA